MQADPFFEGNDDILKSYGESRAELDPACAFPTLLTLARAPRVAAPSAAPSEFDYKKIISFQSELLWWATLFPPCCIPCNVLNTCLCLVPNVRDLAHSNHLAITRDGIRYIVDKHPTAWRLSMCDVGKQSKTIPFDKLTDCDVQEPAGTACCCCVPNILSVVTADTASGREMALAGLKDPFAFKKDVWAMKRGDGLEGVHDSIVATSMTRVEPKPKSLGESSSTSGGWFSGKGPGGEEVQSLLKEQTTLLRTAVGYLKVIADK
jgi:hypothetical protein